MNPKLVGTGSVSILYIDYIITIAILHNYTIDILFYNIIVNSLTSHKERNTSTVNNPSFGDSL